MEGENIYQFEIPFVNGASRVVFELINGNTLSFLFMDPNHHIYLDKRKVDASHSFFYEYCPKYLELDECPLMEQFQTCIAFEYIDILKFSETYGYSFEPKIK